MIKYHDLGGHRSLNDIVMAGSHDAGIVSGGKNVQTQDLDILGQAVVGVRVFDLRIAAAAAGVVDGQKQVELRAFHADDKVKKDEAKVRLVGGNLQPVMRTKLSAGAFGQGLESMLGQARTFVESPQGATEFLILKFDKCLNWMLIADACTFVLGDAIYKGGGNLNTTDLDHLQGKVVVLFSEGGANQVAGLFGPAHGILRFKNLYGGGAYDNNFAGLQYYGKGGTSVVKPFKKQSQNESKQRKLMEQGRALQQPQVMGMMYWTTTGLSESIKKRNAKMWSRPNVEKMKRLWANGLQDYIEANDPLNIGNDSPLFGLRVKEFMPNIVMIDFADPRKCQTIYDLNNMSPHDLALVGRDN